MNKRMKELGRQAGLNVARMLDYNGEEYECFLDRHGAVPSMELSSKFFELIVKEAIAAIRAKYVDYGTTAAVIAVEKHFGVEE